VTAGAVGSQGPGGADGAAADEIRAVRAQLQLATQAAQQAYRDSSRLIRLLAVIGEPAAPDVLIDRTLGALSEVFYADLTCLVYSDGDSCKIITARGFGEREVPRLPVLPGAADLLNQNRLAAWLCPDGDPVPEAAGVPIRSAAHIPLVEATPAGEGLLLLRSDRTRFSPGELQMLQSVAARLRATLEEGERREAIERLARTGHQLTRHLEIEPLLGEALRLLRDMTGAEAASAVTVEHGLASLRVEVAARSDVPGVWPVPTRELLAWPSALRGESFVLDDMHTAPPNSLARVPTWVRNLACVPVLQDGTPIALLYVGHSRPGFFSRSTIEAAAVLAGYVGAALVNARLYSALVESESQLRLLTDELRRRATHDPLTGLANRDLARQLLDTSLASDDARLVGLLFCDLDKFKAINDRLGHEAGDDLLCQVAARLQSCVRPGDLLARLGGDEFLIVLPKVIDLEEVTKIGHRVLATLAEPFHLGEERVQVAASIGGVVGERGAGRHQAVDLLRDADAAMYAAKNRGRARVEVFDRFTAQKAVDYLSLREDMLTALDRDELEVHYQPIVDLLDERVIGFEALLRWNHHDLGSVSPAVFIPMAEETGAITEIGGWVLTEACRQLAEWHREFEAPLSIAVNVSPIQLLDPAFAEKCLRTIEEAGLRTGQVWLEVTESVEVTDQLTEQLCQLRDLGVRVAMDDFGMSYSNLGYLKHLPVERLKIDRTFVAGLVQAPDCSVRAGLIPSQDGRQRSAPRSGIGMDRGIVRAILAIAESAGMSVVAEGIETEEQRRVLLDLGCRQGQGYLFARPMTASAACCLLAEADRLLVEAAEHAVGR
jgi:diguanylate cyclase (GGDEF)-like protein